MSYDKKFLDKGLRLEKEGKLIDAAECYVKTCLKTLNSEFKPTASEALGRYVALAKQIILNTAFRGKDTDLIDRIGKIQSYFVENFSRKNNDKLFDESELLQVYAIDLLIGKYRLGNLSFLADESLKQPDLKQKLLDALVGVEKISIIDLASNLGFSSIATLKLVEAGIKQNAFNGHLTKDELNKIYFSSDYVRVFLAKKLGEDSSKIIKQTTTVYTYPIPPGPSSVTLTKRSQKKLIASIFIIVIVVAAVIGGSYFAANPSSLPYPTLTASPTPTAKENIIMQGISIDSTHKILTMYAQSTGVPIPVVNNIIIKDASGSTIATVGIASISPTAPGNALATGTLYTITSAVLTNALGSGTYTATLTTVAGGSFISPAYLLNNNGNGGTTNPTPTPTVSVAGAATLTYSANVTTSGATTEYKWAGKNMHSTNETLRVDFATYAYILDASVQKSWMSTDSGATWTQGVFADDWTAWGPQWSANVDNLAYWTSGDTYTYTETATGATVLIFNIVVNPTIPASTFSTS